MGTKQAICALCTGLRLASLPEAHNAVAVLVAKLSGPVLALLARPNPLDPWQKSGQYASPDTCKPVQVATESTSACKALEQLGSHGQLHLLPFNAQFESVTNKNYCASFSLARWL